MKSRFSYFEIFEESQRGEVSLCRFGEGEGREWLVMLHIRST
jgi:hypothetical protein